MARLTEQEKIQLQLAAERKTPRQPPVPRMTPEQFAEFATFASQFSTAPKPVRFEGQHWKL